MQSHVILYLPALSFPYHSHSFHYLPLPPLSLPLSPTLLITSFLPPLSLFLLFPSPSSLLLLNNLSTLAFSSSAHPPLQLVQNCAEHYLTSEHKSIRMEAVRTCAALLVPNLLPPTIFTNPFVTFSAASAQVVGDVLGKLLTVGITDPGMKYILL